MEIQRIQSESVLLVPVQRRMPVTSKKLMLPMRRRIETKKNMMRGGMVFIGDVLWF